MKFEDNRGTMYFIMLGAKLSRPNTSPCTFLQETCLLPFVRLGTALVVLQSSAAEEGAMAGTYPMRQQALPHLVTVQHAKATSVTSL